MNAATRPRAPGDPARLLIVDPERDAFDTASITDLPEFVGQGDTLVLNDAATLPASLRVSDALELRLCERLDETRFLALCLGHGTWQTPTEARGVPPRLAAGTVLEFGHGLSARVLEGRPEPERLIEIAFEQRGAALWQALYRAGRPIQYSYLEKPLALWDVQNGYASRPWAFELPSAGKPLSFETLFRIEARGARLTRLTHAAGISSTGSARLDAQLPLPERYELDSSLLGALRESRERGGRVLAIGTSVVRALEAASTEIRSNGSRVTSLLLGPGSRLQTCSGLLTGMHEPQTSHFSLLEAFAPRALLARSFSHAERLGFLQHEFGDSCLVLRGALGSGAQLLQAS